MGSGVDPSPWRLLVMASYMFWPHTLSILFLYLVPVLLSGSLAFGMCAVHVGGHSQVMADVSHPDSAVSVCRKLNGYLASIITKPPVQPC